MWGYLWLECIDPMWIRRKSERFKCVTTHGGWSEIGRSRIVVKSRIRCISEPDPSGLDQLCILPIMNYHNFRVSESIQERQHQLLSATNSDPVRTRTCDAPSVPASKHPQFAMPMSKPVLLRAQNNTKASVADPTVTQHKLQQPRRLEKELAFGEVQWTQVKVYQEIWMAFFTKS